MLKSSVFARYFGPLFLAITSPRMAPGETALITFRLHGTPPIIRPRHRPAAPAHRSRLPPPRAPQAAARSPVLASRLARLPRGRRGRAKPHSNLRGRPGPAGRAGPALSGVARVPQVEGLAIERAPAQRHYRDEVGAGGGKQRRGALNEHVEQHRGHGRAQRGQQRDVAKGCPRARHRGQLVHEAGAQQQ
nr:hypothetical protein [Tanacetum cinerariifolium]